MIITKILIQTARVASGTETKNENSFTLFTHVNNVL